MRPAMPSAVPADVALLDAIEQEMAQQDPRAWAALEREELRLLGEKYTPGGIPPDKLQQHVKKFRLVYGSLSPGAIQKLGERLQSPQMAEGKILITPTKDGQVPAGLQSFTIPASQSGAHRPTALPQQYRVEPPSPGLRSLLTLTSWNKTAAPSAPPPSTTFSPGPGFPRLGSQPSKAAQFPTQTATSATAQYQNTPGVPAPTTSQPTLLDPLDFAAQVAARRVAENAELTASMEQQGRVIQIPYPGGPIKHNPFKTIPRAPPQKTTAPLSAFIAPRGKRVGRSYQGPLPSEADIYPDDSEFIASPERGESSSVLGQIERTPVALGQPGAFTFATPTPAQRKTTATLNVAAAPFTPAVPKADPITTQFGVPVTETDTSRTALPIPSSTQRINWLDPIHNFQPSTFTQQGSSTKGFGGQPSNIPGLGASSTTPWTTTGPQGVTTYPIGHTEGITVSGNIFNPSTSTWATSAADSSLLPSLLGNPFTSFLPSVFPGSQYHQRDLLTTTTPTRAPTSRSLATHTDDPDPFENLWSPLPIGQGLINATAAGNADIEADSISDICNVSPLTEDGHEDDAGGEYGSPSQTHMHATPARSTHAQSAHAPSTCGRVSPHLRTQSPRLIYVDQTPMAADQEDGSRYGLKLGGLGLPGFTWAPPKPVPGTRFSGLEYLWR